MTCSLSLSLSIITSILLFIVCASSSCPGALKVAHPFSACDPTPPYSCFCWRLLIGCTSIQSNSPGKDTEHIELISDCLIVWWQLIGSRECMTAWPLANAVSHTRDWWMEAGFGSLWRDFVVWVHFMQTLTPFTVHDTALTLTKTIKNIKNCFH